LSKLTRGRFNPSRVTPDTTIKAALVPVKLLQSIGEIGSDIGNRFAVQPLYLD
jgi:hypothetical protein